MEPEYPAATRLITPPAGSQGYYKDDRATKESKTSERATPGGLADLAFGSLAGMNGKVMEYPFDTVKVRLQTTKGDVFNGTTDCLMQTWRQEGFKGFYRGVTSPLVGAMAENAIAFFSYNRIQNFIRYVTSTPTETPLSIPQLFAAGAFAGCAGSLILTPIELIKCKLQVENVQSYGGGSGVAGSGGATTAAASRTKFVGPISVIKSILAKKGVAGLYNGFSPTLARECLGSGFWFGTYEAICRGFLKYKERKLKEKGEVRVLSKDDLHPLMLILAGGFAGVAYNSSSYPIDVIKSNIQTADVRSPQGSRPPGWVETARTVYANGGIKAFYRGLGITLIRAFPANAAMFMTYEYLIRASSKLYSN
ncbi:mitochondrial ornithine carrier protein [Mycoemilia scoparia]|uniref:Mitochondrial ornithine carrier protein n=1 Tax=Mycoemilia scoparia TaxID=417184 RepID=A0A9W8A0K9_9FUNG|nr:mitochondrial ornithine carrier protein [Mycoemilia scoparia]